MYWCAHKTATLTSIQHTVPPFTYAPGQTQFHYLSRETEYKILDTVEAIQDHLDDHLLKTQIMRGSPYFKAFESMY